MRENTSQENLLQPEVLVHAGRLVGEERLHQDHLVLLRQGERRRRGGRRRRGRRSC